MYKPVFPGFVPMRIVALRVTTPAAAGLAHSEKLITVLPTRGEPRFSFRIFMGRNKHQGSLVLRVTGTQSLRITHFNFEETL